MVGAVWRTDYAYTYGAPGPCGLTFTILKVCIYFYDQPYGASGRTLCLCLICPILNLTGPPLLFVRFVLGFVLFLLVSLPLFQHFFACSPIQSTWSNLHYSWSLYLFLFLCFVIFFALDSMNSFFRFSNSYKDSTIETGVLLFCYHACNC